jgi:hypothetical protein
MGSPSLLYADVLWPVRSQLWLQSDKSEAKANFRRHVRARALRSCPQSALHSCTLRTAP